LDAAAITIIFIILSALIAVVIRKIKKDKCLKDFRDDMVTLELLNGQQYRGKLHLKSSGLQFNYPEIIEAENKLKFLSFLLYKNEYPDIQAVVRYHKDLTEEGKKLREKDFRKTFQPSRWRRLRRSTLNFLKIIKDAVIEIINMMTSNLSKTTPVGAAISSNDNQVNKMKNEVYNLVETSYEPLLEDYIGERVILELKRGSDWVKYNGVLKDYTAEFIELINVDYAPEEKGKIDADLIVLRKYGIVRNLSE
jgi:small nuclear ribonucleoprotein (snRNP)-like protein